MNHATGHSSPNSQRGIDRRSFLGGSVMAAGAGLLAAASPARAQAAAEGTAKKFKLKYAPTFGMFAAHAGNDLAAQLRFMAEACFSALLAAASCAGRRNSRTCWRRSWRSWG